MLFIGQKEVFSEGSETFKALLQLKVCSSQLQRLCRHYGEKDLVDETLQNPDNLTLPTEDATLYVQVDGSNIFTDDGWKEVKLGRIFSSSDIRLQTSKYEGVAPRTTILKSDYLSYKGKHGTFTERFDKLLDKHISSSYNEVVFITDGETWIDNWLEENYGNHPRILDYYHGVKPLKAFAEKAIKSETKRNEWLDKQKKLLLAGQAKKVLKNAEAIKSLTKTADRLKQDLIRYYQNNNHRMDYHTYRQNGWYIGSGAIESAHRVVIQKRMKLSGQRWGNNAQPILNLRAIYKSNKWNKMIDIIKANYNKKAA